MLRSLIILPTYNERGNIAALTEAILRQPSGQNEILIVDDTSPDGTGELAEELGRADARIHVLKRARKMGLGSAYLQGFEWGLSRKFSALYQMDADFSHDPAYLPIFGELLERGEVDAVIGSRYIPGGGIEHWGLLRRWISRFGSLYAGLWLRSDIKDLTGGFNAWTAQALSLAGFEKIQSQGYCFQIELKTRAAQAGCRLIESPIVFSDRHAGKSKMSGAIVWEAMWRVPYLALGKSQHG